MTTRDFALALLVCMAQAQEINEKCRFECY
jgi:hypothetical protein